MKKLNRGNWSRKTHFDIFKNIEKPQFSICTKIDVTELVRSNENFFNHFLFLLMQSSNEVEEFKLRIINGEVYSFDSLDINFNLLAKDNCFVSRRANYSKDYSLFNKEVQAIKEDTPKEGTLQIDKSEGANVVITSFLPWTHFDSVSEPIFSKDESLIKMVYGKYHEVNDRYMVPLCVTAHHGLVDGYHMGQFFNLLQDKMKLESNSPK